MTLREQLIRDEDEVLHVYPDSLGYWTIGIGRLVDARKGGGISHEEALMLLDNDIRDKTADLLTALPWVANLDDARKGALINMTFQMGIYGLLEFKATLSAIKEGRWQEAHNHMLDSEWAKQTPQRAKRMAKQILTGEWQ